MSQASPRPGQVALSFGDDFFGLLNL
jgi:hypothetical protein